LPRDGPDHPHFVGNRPCPSPLTDYWIGISWVCLSHWLVWVLKALKKKSMLSLPADSTCTPPGSLCIFLALTFNKRCLHPRVLLGLSIANIQVFWKHRVPLTCGEAQGQRAERNGLEENKSINKAFYLFFFKIPGWPCPWAYEWCRPWPRLSAWGKPHLASYRAASSCELQQLYLQLQHVRKPQHLRTCAHALALKPCLPMLAASAQQPLAGRLAVPERAGRGSTKALLVGFHRQWERQGGVGHWGCNRRWPR
jgi:hypothetical protein